MLLFLAVIAAISGWWLSQQRLMSKPWLEEGALGGSFPGTGASLQPAAKLGLGIFLAVVGSLFALLISAYVIRIDVAAPALSDRAAMPVPSLLWFNTGALVLGSIALQWAWIDARRRRMDGVRVHLLAACVATVAFVSGQFLVWLQLVQAGYFLASSPVNAFFYLLTGIHALHVLGGLVALGRNTTRVWRNVAVERVRLGIELCAIYWHFLLLIWLIVFAVLLGWADDFADICRALIT